MIPTGYHASQTVAVGLLTVTDVTALARLPHNAEFLQMASSAVLQQRFCHRFTVDDDRIGQRLRILKLAPNDTTPAPIKKQHVFFKVLVDFAHVCLANSIDSSAAWTSDQRIRSNAQPADPKFMAAIARPRNETLKRPPDLYLVHTPCILTTLDRPMSIS